MSNFYAILYISSLRNTFEEHRNSSSINNQICNKGKLTNVDGMQVE